MKGISQKNVRNTKKEDKHVFKIQEQQEQRDKEWNYLIQYEVWPNSRSSLQPKKSKQRLDNKRLYQRYIRKKEKKATQKRKLNEKRNRLQSRKRIILMIVQKFDQGKKNQRRKFCRYLRKNKGSLQQRSNKTKIEDIKTRDNEEKNDEDMQLIREKFLLPEGLLEETEIY